MNQSDQTTSTTSTLQDDIASLEEKREVLQQIIEIAKAIEDMQEGLEATLLLGASSKAMQEGALILFSSLSDSLRNLPTNKIKEYLQNMEMIIKNQLDKILHYSGMDFSSDEAIEFLCLSSDSSEESPLELLEEFKKTAQTSVALKVLLKKRGVSSPGSSLPVARDVIVKQMEQLEAQEKHQRAKIRDKIIDMQDDITRMIANPDYPEGMKELLAGVRDNLDSDLDNLKAGGKLSRLNFVVDAQEIADIQPPAKEEEKTPEHAEHQHEVGFYETANRWLNSSWDVGWKDIKKSD